MRNLKRVLSLGMTAAMITGLMVVGTSAAGYSDVSTEDNVEAIEVLQSVGVMVGDENGDFNPDQLVTRNEMAVVMSNLMEYNVATPSPTCPPGPSPMWLPAGPTASPPAPAPPPTAATRASPPLRPL